MCERSILVKTSKKAVRASPARPFIALLRCGGVSLRGPPHAARQTSETSFAVCVMSMPRRSRLNGISTAITMATVPATIAMAIE